MDEHSICHAAILITMCLNLSFHQIPCFSYTNNHVRQLLNAICLVYSMQMEVISQGQKFEIIITIRCFSDHTGNGYPLQFLMVFAVVINAEQILLKL